MKICFVGNKMSLVSGHSKPLYELAIELLKKGHEIIMISTKLQADIAEKHYLLCPKYPELKKLHVIELSKLNWKNIQRQGIFSLLKQCDIIHVCTPSLSLLRHLTKNFNDRVIWQIVSDYITFKDIYNTGICTFVKFSLHYPKNIALILHKFFYKPIGGKCIKILCSNKYMLERLTKLGFKQEKLKYVPLGVHPKRAFDKDQSLTTGKLVYLYFGWLSPIRGVPNLLSAFEIVKSYEPNAELIVANPGSHLEDCEMTHLINQSALANSIKVKPWQSDIEPLIHSANAVVLPFRSNMGYSQPPLTVIESMNLGKAVISTKLGSVDELIVDGKTGLLVEPGDVDGLARAMLRIADKRFAEKIGENAYKEMRSKYNWDTIVNEYLEIYRCYAS